MPQLYPHILLPKTNYHTISINDILDQFMVRYVDRENSLDSITDVDGKVKAEFIYSPQERIEDLSISLLGHYELEFVKFRFTNESKDYYSELWEQGSVNEPTDPKDFYIDNNRAFWHIPVKVLNGRKVNVTVGDGKKLKTLPAKSSINHKPTKGNFWHYTLNWNVDGFDLDDEHTYSANERKKMAKKISATERALIIDAALTNTIKPIGIAEVTYSKN